MEGRVSLPITTKIVLWPKMLWEFRGCEDPRLYKIAERFIMLYTGYGYMIRDKSYSSCIVQAFALFEENYNCLQRNYFRIQTLEGDLFLPRANKDSAILNIDSSKVSMLMRPLIRDIEVGWFVRADLKDAVVYEESMSPSLAFEPWEIKVGWSTNVVKLSSNEYLVGWHGIFKEDYSYRNGLAIIDSDGNLLAISNYLLVPSGLVEEYGDRPLVIFGNGLISYKEKLLWIGGVSDYAIGFFMTDLDNALEKIKWING